MAGVLFLIDRSSSLADRAAGLASAVDHAVRTLIDEAGDAPVEVALIGYHTDRLARPVIGPIGGEETWRTLDSLRTRPTRVDRVTRESADMFTGEIVQETVEVPAWVEPIASGGTPLRAALVHCRRLLDDRPKSPKPWVIHLGDGLARDGDPSAEAEALRSVAMVANARPAGADSLGRSLFPARAEPGFALASVLPDDIRRRVSAESPDVRLEPGARALALDADESGLLDFLDILTRVALAS